MKKRELIKAIAAILVPFGIPTWIGYKLYEYIKKVKSKDSK